MSGTASTLKGGDANLRSFASPHLPGVAFVKAVTQSFASPPSGVCFNSALFTMGTDLELQFNFTIFFETYQFVPQMTFKIRVDDKHELKSESKNIRKYCYDSFVRVWILEKMKFILKRFINLKSRICKCLFPCRRIN